MRHPSRLAADQRGTTITEFALILPVLLTLVCGAIDLGYLFLAQTTLNGAVMQGAQVASASMEQTETQRKNAFTTGINRAMSAFAGTPPTVQIKVYRTFGTTFPEDYIDSNHNGAYDPPAGSIPGESFTDRNGNGQWDADVPLASGASMMGDVGDVVSYSASLPVRHLFAFVGFGSSTVTMKAYSVMRNEATKTE